MICVLNGNFPIMRHESVSTTKTATRGSVFAEAVGPFVSMQLGSGVSPLRLGHKRALSAMTVIKGQSTCGPTLKKLSYKDWPVEAHSHPLAVVWASDVKCLGWYNEKQWETEQTAPLYGKLRPCLTQPLRLKARFQSHPAVLSRSLFIMVDGRWRICCAWALFIVTCFSLVPNLTSGSIPARSEGVYNNYGTRGLDPHMSLPGTHVSVCF